MKFDESDLQVRPALLHDLPALVRIAEAEPELPRWPASVFQAMVEQAPSPVLRYLAVVVVSSEVVAFGVLTMLPADSLAEGEIENLAVSPEWRCRGIGKAVMADMLAHARGLGVSSIHLEVRSRNTSALRLYASLGFVTSGRRPGYYAHPADDALLLEVHLTVSPGASLASGIIRD